MGLGSKNRCVVWSQRQFMSQSASQLAAAVSQNQR
jgi:hypothetical protein